MKDGSFGQYFEVIPTGTTIIPDKQLLGLITPQRKTQAENRYVNPTIYTDEMQERLHRAWENHQHVFANMPTTAELIPLMAEEIRRELQTAKHPQVLLLAGRESALTQEKLWLTEADIPHRIFKYATIANIRKQKVAVGSVLSLQKNFQELAPHYYPTLIILDDIDCTDWSIGDQLVSKWPKARMLNLTTFSYGLTRLEIPSLFTIKLFSWGKNGSYDQLMTIPQNLALLRDYSTGLIIYFQDLLGIYKSGYKLPPIYSRIDRLYDSDYFAVATIGYHEPPIRTVIDKNGKDLQADLSGRVREIGNGFFEYGSDSNPHFWDATTGFHYNEHPIVEKIGKLDFFVADGKYCPRLRNLPQFGQIEVEKKDIYYNDYITVTRDKLIVHATQKVYQVYGYSNNHILVWSNRGFSCCPVTMDGIVGYPIRQTDNNKWHKEPNVGPFFPKDLKRAEE